MTNATTSIGRPRLLLPSFGSVRRTVNSVGTKAAIFSTLALENASIAAFGYSDLLEITPRVLDFLPVKGQVVGVCQDEHVADGAGSRGEAVLQNVKTCRGALPAGLINFLIDLFAVLTQPGLQSPWGVPFVPPEACP